MTEIELTFRVSAPPERVYAALTRPENLGAVLPGIRGAALLEGSAWAPGARLLLRTASGRFREARVRRHDPEARVTEVVEETGVVDRWVVEPAAGGARVTHVVEGRFTSRARKRLLNELVEKGEILRLMLDVHASVATPERKGESDY